MIRKGILIPWKYSEEYIEIDLASLDRLSEITSTTEWWPKEKKTVRYSTSSTTRKHRDGAIDITIRYEKDLNRHLKHEDISWGNAIINIKKNAPSGVARMIDIEFNENNNEVNWTKIDVPLIGERKRESTSRIQREQQKLRSALLAWDVCCVLTGEKTKEVLEAAHIIPASLGGAEVLENGILLRSDLHRLLDNNIIAINIDGDIVMNDDIAESYRRLLRNARLSEQTLRRVMPALVAVAKNRNT